MSSRRAKKAGNPKGKAGRGNDTLTLDDLGFLRMVWQGLTPLERSRRCWRMRRLLKDPQAVHDAKLWPRI
ncbi:MAG: hypothetical protein HY608_07690 [Planctomycetes bacterium]|nr:hypothetical protein [Planctomycetota bacterium]